MGNSNMSENIHNFFHVPLREGMTSVIINYYDSCLSNCLTVIGRNYSYDNSNSTENKAILGVFNNGK